MGNLKQPRSMNIHVDDSATLTMSPVKTFSPIDHGLERKGEAWFVATELRSDLIVEAVGLTFHLHKFPLLSRSGRINRLVFESRDLETTHIVLAHMPGGAETFQLAARFCYGMPIDLSAVNIAAVRCMADYLEMSDDLEEGNLISKTETFINNVVLHSWKNSISVLKSCEQLSPWAEDLKIVSRCCESIAWKACTDPRVVKSPCSKAAAELPKDRLSPGNQSTGDDAKKHVISQDWWFDDLVSLKIGHFRRVITAISAKGMRPDLIGSAIIHYSLKWLPDVGKLYDQTIIHYTEEDEERSDFGSGISCDLVARADDSSLILLEHIIRILPPEEDAIPSNFLIHLMKIASILDVDADCKADLEQRIGSQLDQATLNDLLIPAFCSEYETFFDVELVQRLLEYFLLKEQNGSYSISGPLLPSSEAQGFDASPRPFKAAGQPHAKVKVAKLLDSYLSEIAKDKNLPLSKFQSFAELIPEDARISHDGLYCAIDIFLKNHPSLTEHERKRVCRIMDCQKLSLQACVHAAQNEYLPLRTVIQVLFCEHMKVRNALTGNEADEFHKSDDPWKKMSLAKTPQLEELATVNEEMKSLRSELHKMKEDFSEFRSEYSHLHQEMHHFAKHKMLSTWLAGLKKLGKLKHMHLPHAHHHKDHHHHHHQTDHAKQLPENSSPNHGEDHKHHRNWRHSVS